MELTSVIDGLLRNGELFAILLAGADKDFRDWKPAPDKWSPREILCHLLDEERCDFRARVKHVLETPEEPMAPIDPVGWVQSRNYGMQDFAATLQLFLEERNASIEYLKGLGQENWEQRHDHPRLGAMRAKDFLHNWLAHDYLHLRQLIRYQYEWFRQRAGGDLSYAGDW